MYICDTHCDTLCKILDDKSDLLNSVYEVNIHAVSGFEHYTQVFACFIDPQYKKTAYERCKQLIAAYNEQTKKFNIAKCCSVNELLVARRENRTAAFLGIEGGECIRTIEDLEEFYGDGVRFAALTWNFDNHIAGGAMDLGEEGLTLFGKEVVQKMNALGMIIDVSHLNKKSFYDIAKISTLPLAATHSCSDSVCPHKRNLTDEQFCLIRDSGGYVGINFYPKFLNGTDKACIDDIIMHIDHFLSLGGKNTIGLGSDFDGISHTPIDMPDCSYIRRLVERISEEFGAETALKIASGNFERLLYQLG